MSEKKNKLGSVGRILLLVIISLLVGARLYSWNAKSLAGNAMPMPFGFGMSVVLSGSMEPTLSVDDLVFVRQSETYQVDDIVVYQDGNSLVIHRIMSIDGETVITKGDANDAPDEPITLSLVKGKAVGHIPYVGAVARFLKSSAGFLIVLVAAVVLLELPYWQKRKKQNEEQERIKEEIRKLKGE